ncbi:hypothetical protein [uncultured Pseudoalteromonas sp.]|uniref:hypothetical protein n=2 Tax=uncultured Pseudoalteromonas sp. TaxID=114053 RepID=UPI0026085774|nr:hypothetical protein [uncultured Pseudoalteromonas sp.]
MRFFLSATALAVSMSMVAPVAAKWGNDTSTFVTATQSSASHKTVVDHKGNIIVGYSDPSTGYDFLINKLDRHGNFAWEQGAKTLYDREQSFILTWSMMLDDEGAIYTGFEDLNVYPYSTMVFKTNSDGSAGWEEPFIPTPEDAGRTLPIHLTSADDKLFYALDYDTKSRSAKVAVGMLDKNGNELWQIAEQMGSTRFSSFTPVKDGLVVVFSGSREDGANSLFVQKYDFDGNPLWGESPQAIMFGDISLPARASTTAAIVPDGQGGVTLAWSHPTLFNRILMFQHIDNDGQLQFPNSGLRLSHGDDLEFDNAAHPALLATDDGYLVAWAAQYSKNNFGNYGLFMQHIAHDGSLMLGSEPVSLVPILYGDTQDSGYYSAGYLSRYDETFSFTYLKSEDYTSQTENLYRVDFKIDGSLINNQVIAKVDKVINGESISHSPFGETIASLRTTVERDAAVQLQSIKQNGEVGNEEGIRLAWPDKPLTTHEDQPFSIRLPFVDELSSDYSIRIEGTSENDNSDYSAEIDNSSVLVQITPSPEYAGKLPFVLTLTDDKDSSRTRSMNYTLNVTQINDTPSISMPQQIAASEDEVVVVSAEVTDPDNSSLNIEWLQTSGPTVDFDPTAMELSFTSPVVNKAVDLVFSLNVNDGESATTASTKVTIANDKKPTLSGPSNINVEEGNRFNIDLLLSAAKGPSSISWQQLSGPAITLSHPQSLATQGSAPFIDNKEEQATLAVSVTDAHGETTTHQVNVIITNNKSSGSFGLSLMALFGMLLCRRSRHMK